MTVRMTVQNSNKSFHETYISVTPSLLRLGVIKRNVTPEGNQKEIKGGTAYRGAGSTNYRLTRNSTNCKGNITKRSMSLENVICPVFIWAWKRTVGVCHLTEHYPKSHGFLCALLPGGSGNQCIGTKCVASLSGGTAARQIMLLKYETFLV